MPLTPLYPGSCALAQLGPCLDHSEPGRALAALLSTQRTACLTCFSLGMARSVRSPDLGQLGFLLVPVGAVCLALVHQP